MQIIKINFKKYFLLIPIFLTVIVTLLTLKKGLIIAGGDVPLMEFFPYGFLKSSFFLWNNLDALGRPAGVVSAGVIFYGLDFVLTKFLEPDLVQKIIFFVLALAPIFSLNFLIKRVFGKERYYLVSLVATTFYIFNLYQLQNWSFALIMYQVAYFTTPLMLALLQEKNDNSKNRFIFSITVLVNTIIASNLAIFLGQVLIIIIFTLCQIIFSENKKHTLSFFVKYWLIYIIVNCFWVVSFLNSYLGNVSLAINNDWNQIITQGSIQATVQYNNLANSVRLISSTLYGYWLGVYDFPFYQIYTKPFFVILNYSFPAISVLGLILFWKKIPSRGFFVFLVSLTVIGIFLSKGGGDPWGQFYLSALEKFPFLSMFRTPQNKFGPMVVLAYSILFSWSIYEIIITFARQYYLRIIFFFSVIVIICINIFPYWQGKMFFPKYQVQLPSYYQETADYINKNDDFQRILILPFYESTWISTKWGYIGYDPLYYLIDKPYFSRGAEWLNNFNALANNKIIYALNKGDRNEFEFVLKNYSINKIIVHRDYNYSTFSIPRVDDKLQKMLANNENFSFEKNIGQLDVYNYKPTEDSQEISLNSDPLIVSGNLDNIVQTSGYDNVPNTFLQSEQNSQKLNTLQEFFGKHYYDLTADNVVIKNNKLTFDDSIINSDDQIQIKTNNTLSKLIMNGYKYTLSRQVKLAESIYTLNHNEDISYPAKISFDITTQSTKINNSSFEEIDSAWELNDSSPNSSGKSIFYKNRSEDAVDGKYSLKLESKNHLAGLRQQVNNLDKDSFYHISFFYKHVSGKMPAFVVEGIETDNNRILFSQQLEKTNKWQREDLIFKTDSYENVYLWLYSQPDRGQDGVNLYDKIELEKINSPVESVYIFPKDEERNAINYSFTKKNQTKYVAEVEGVKQPFLLRLNQSFSSKWQAFIIKDGKKHKISEQNHLIANYYANSWVIDEKGDYKIIIEYSNQKLFIASYLLVGILLVYLFVMFWIKKHFGTRT